MGLGQSRRGVDDNAVKELRYNEKLVTLPRVLSKAYVLPLLSGN